MDMKFAEIISLFRWAENALIVERNYFDARADDPFINTEARLEAMAAMMQLEANLTELRFKKEDLISAYEGGKFLAPSEDTLEKVRKAAEELSKALTNSANVKAVVLAATDFFGVVGALNKLEVPSK